MGLAITLLPIVQSLARFCGPALVFTFGSLNEDSSCDFSNPYYYLMSGIYIGVSSLLMVLSAIFIFVKS